MAGVPSAGQFARGYAATLGASYNPVINAITGRITDLQGRIAGAPESVADLYSGARTAAANVGTNMANVNNQFLGALSGLNLPGLDPSALGLAARGTGRSDATAAVIGSMLQSQVGQSQALSTLAAQRSLSDQLTQATMERAQAQGDRARTRADWLPYAQQRQQMNIERITSGLQNRLARGQITQQQLANDASIVELRRQGYKVKVQGGKVVVTDSSGRIITGERKNV